MARAEQTVGWVERAALLAERTALVEAYFGALVACSVAANSVERALILSPTTRA